VIVSASRRTDIPAYYADWFMGRIEAGWCLVRNPFDARRTNRVSLEPEDVDFLVLWTRDPRPLAERMHALDGRGIRSYVHMTITGYPAVIEPGAIPVEDALDALRSLSDAIGKRRVLWRYDPILVARGIDADWHRRNFERIASVLEGKTERVTLSLLDEYAHTASRLARAGYPDAVFGSKRESGGDVAQPALFDTDMPVGPAAPAVRRLPPEPYPRLLADLAGLARAHGMTALACAEPFDLSGQGIDAGACVDSGLAASLWGVQVPAGKDSGQRGACRCAPSVDIGSYGSCPRGCLYCYASRGAGRLLARGPGDPAL
jgi:hypothetical protein